MKMMTLNIWGGHIRSPLLEFIKNHQEVDIFCLQEVYHNAQEKMSDDDRVVSLNIFSEIQALLPHHRGFFRPVTQDAYGIGMFIKNDINVLREGDFSIHENHNYRGRGPTHSRKLQWIECLINNKNHFIVNVHGLWNGMGKSDSPERVAQSQKIREFLDAIDTPKILCGDFNLRPDTESLKILEEGMNNLVQIYEITSTRTSFYDKEEKFADYVFTSPDIAIKAFKKLMHEVSDHAPLWLEIET